MAWFFATVRSRIRRNLGFATVAFLATMAAVVATAVAAINPSRDANAVTGAIADSAPAGSVTGASFPIIPPTAECSNGIDDDGDGLTDFPADPDCASAQDDDEFTAGDQPVDTTGINPAAVADSGLASFPTSGTTFGILSSGDATFADDPNDSESTGASNNGGDGGHGSSFFDVVTLKVDVNVPASSNCAQIDFRFLSDEFPEFVGSNVNDGFVAELDTSDFSADPAQNNKVIAPHNFAFDQDGNVISVNTSGPTAMSAAEASGTTYDGATPPLRASTPITSGPHSIFLSVFDQGDSIYDSAAFIDHLQLVNLPGSACHAGATADFTPPDTTITHGPANGSTISDATPTFKFTSTEANSTFECSVDGGNFQSCNTPFTTHHLDDGQHTFAVRAIDQAGNVDPTPAHRSFKVHHAAPQPQPHPHHPSLKCAGSKATIVGTSHGDNIHGTRKADVIVARGGNDKIHSLRGADKVCSNKGKDTVGGGRGDDFLRGGGGNDSERGGRGHDILRGKQGDDVLRGGRNGDLLGGGRNSDALFGGRGNDILHGGNGIDQCFGGSGNNLFADCE
jgi:Ca2+-binding RTX toxin-like protein